MKFDWQDKNKWMLLGDVEIGDSFVSYFLEKENGFVGYVRFYYNGKINYMESCRWRNIQTFLYDRGSIITKSKELMEIERYIQ